MACMMGVLPGRVLASVAWSLAAAHGGVSTDPFPIPQFPFFMSLMEVFTSNQLPCSVSGHFSSCQIPLHSSCLTWGSSEGIEVFLARHE